MISSYYSTRSSKAFILALLVIISIFTFHKFENERQSLFSSLQTNGSRPAQQVGNPEGGSTSTNQQNHLTDIDLAHDGAAQTNSVEVRVELVRTTTTVTVTAPEPSETEEALSLPAEYKLVEEDKSWCQDRFDTNYLHRLRDGRFRFCGHEDEYKSRVDCFAVPGDEERMDTFCYAQNAVFNLESESFHLPCTDDFNLPHGRFPVHWGDIGMEITMLRLMEWDTKMASKTCEGPPNNVVIIKRDGTKNFWHTMMEIITVTLSIDVLRITKSEITGKPLFTDDDIARTQIVIADDYPNGPLLELWSLVAGLPVARLSYLQSTEALKSNCPVNILYPLPGGANPLWLGDWTDLPCDHSDLASAWRHRVLNYYGIDSVAPVTIPVMHNEPQPPLLTITILNRTGRRRIFNQEEVVNRTRGALPGVTIQVLDLGALELKEQLAIIDKTDILVGVHGAGLTHSIMMRQGRTVIEILPDGMEGDGQHRGFRNMAMIRGQHYLKMKAHMLPYGDGAEKWDWHFTDVVVDANVFIRVLTSAIDGMSQSGLGDRVIER